VESCWRGKEKIGFRVNYWGLSSPKKILVVGKDLFASTHNELGLVNNIL
jgi:hypothetical protein